jgi:hypothetical protein
MSILSKRSTVYFEPAIHQALKVKAASSQLSISELIDEAIRLLMSKDQDDLAAFSSREIEKEISSEALLNDLKKHGKNNLKKSVAKDLSCILSADIKRILKKIESIATDPRGEGYVKLSSQERYRIRQGL